MKVLLINPSLLQAEVGHYSKAVESQRGVYPPLGLAYVASALEKDGHDVKIIDCDANQSTLHEIVKVTKRFDPDLVGMYVMTWTFRQARQIVDAIKRELPNVKFVMGGPNVTSFPKISLQKSKFDYAVFGEGEITIKKLTNTLEKNKQQDIKKIRGLVFKSSNKVIINRPRLLIKNLDEIDFPAFHLLPIKKYFDVFTRENMFITMITSRGCPFNCTFCDRNNRMGSLWRARSPENILDEIELLNSNYKIREFMFFDDNFIIDKKRVEGLCKEIQKRGLDIIWECRARVDMVNKPLLSKMKSAGCYRIRYGMEAGDDRILKILKKDITVSQTRHCSKITKDVGIELFAYFMMGSPFETLETLKKTFKLALEIDPDFVAFSKTILITGSELFDWAAKNGHIRKDYWKRFLLGKESDSAPSLSTKDLPEPVLDEFVNFATKRFYLRPRYVLKRIQNTRNLEQLFRQVSMAKGLLGS